MDEELLDITIEETVDASVVEVVDTDVTIENEEYDVSTEETVEFAEAEPVEEIEIEIEESIGWVRGDSDRHYSLTGRDDPNQHGIGAITGLRAELDEIERLKTVYSDRFNVANYYKWEDNKTYDAHGYFVSLTTNPSEITICTGDDILGVTVSSAGFVGGQNGLPRDNHYDLVVTSGVVDVRCELAINVGDRVISNAYGYAKKTASNYGYKVLATKEKDGVLYAVIALGVQADQINELGVGLINMQTQVDANYKNTISAVNVANQAYSKAIEVESSKQIMSERVNNAIGIVDKLEDDMVNIISQTVNSAQVAAQAKAIAESVATSAASMKDEAVASANSAVAQVKDLTKTLEPLTTWTDPETGNKGASYLAYYIDNGLATKTEIEAVEDDLEYATSAISKNAKSLQSIIVSIDKYSVGEYSTAYGLTLDQAASILEPGVIYVPTVFHTEKYSYVDGEDTIDYLRDFAPGYLYRWGQLPNGTYGWITVDKNYSEDKLNTSAPAVYFSIEAPFAVGDFGYWYTNSDAVTEGYEPYTLYKWMEDNWAAVATLAGNVNNRSISQVRQTANEVALEVTNARGSAASLGARLTDTESEVQSLAAWTKDANGEQYNLATIKQTADEAGADIALVVQEVDGEKVVNGASIVAAINEQGDSFVGIEAKYVNLKGQVTFESFTKETQDKIEADTIDVQIWSSRGNIFKGRDVASVLTCHVFKAGVDITSTLPNTAFTWEKINHDGSVDERWTATPYDNHANAIQITSSDVFSRAVFNCAVEI